MFNFRIMSWVYDKMTPEEKKELSDYVDETKIYKKAIDDIRKLNFHDMPIPQDSTSFAQFSRKQSKLKSILSKLGRSNGNL